MKRTTENNKLLELDLLCRSGAGLVVIASQVCRLVRELVGGDAASLFWLDEKGMPEGVFHENPPAQAQELFLNEFGRLFVGPGEVNVLHIAQMPQSLPVGNLLAPDRSYFKSNTFNLLVRPSGHHHTLDLGVRLDGRTRAMVMLFRPEGWPFSDPCVRKMQRLEPFLRRALSEQRSHGRWNMNLAQPQLSGHLLLERPGSSRTGWQVRMAGGQALSILRECTLVGQGLPWNGPVVNVPLFLQRACDEYSAHKPHDLAPLQVPAGLVRMELTPMHASGAHAAPGMLVSLGLYAIRHIQLVHRVMGLPLSPLQREIALHAAAGGRRADCESVIGVRDEALKTHLKKIYAATGVKDWTELTGQLSVI